jgi:hypothetical protein
MYRTRTADYNFAIHLFRDQNCLTALPMPISLMNSTLASLHHYALSLSLQGCLQAAQTRGDPPSRCNGYLARPSPHQT